MALNEEQINKLRPLLASVGWRELMRPAITNRANEAIKSLVLLPSERKSGDDGKVAEDADLRARIRECEWMLTAWQNEVNVFDINRARDEAEGRDNGANPQ